MFSASVAPPAANGTTWWNSRKPASAHRPSAPTNAQRPSSRVHTILFTAAGTRREVATPVDELALGVRVDAYFTFSNCSTSTVSARSTTAAGSPFGI
jgi:hypothetical protein